MRPEYKVKESYIGTGLLDEYTFDFRILNLAHLRVIRTTSLGVVIFDNVGTDTSNFTTTLNPDKTGKITLNAGDLDAGNKLIILLADDAPTQPDKYIGQDFYSMKKIENSLDWLAGAIQRLAYRASRAIHLPEKFTNSFDTEIKDVLADGVLVINEDANGLTVLPRAAFKGDKGDSGGAGLPDDPIEGGYIQQALLPSLLPEWVSGAYSGYSPKHGQIINTLSTKQTLDFLVGVAYAPPTISLSGTGHTTLREKGATVTNPTLSAAIGKVSDPIYEVEFTLLPSTSLAVQSSGGAIPNGGTSTYNYVGSFTNNTSFRARVTDNGATGGPSNPTSTINYNFVYPYYYGAGAAGLGAAVAGLTKDIANNTSNYSKSIVSAGSQKLYMAYPASYGALTSILDSNLFEVISTFNASTANITGLDGNAVSYRIYESNNLVIAGSFAFQFKK